MAPAYRQSNAHFTYHNENPKNSKSSGDCVIRAIAFATGNGWDKTYSDLCALGLKMKAMPNDNKVYRKYLEQLGYKQLPQPRKANNTKYTVTEFTRLQGRKGTYIISVANHLTAVKDGKIIDTWDCGGNCVGNYWHVQ